jgi:hypothetical protein
MPAPLSMQPALRCAQGPRPPPLTRAPVAGRQRAMTISREDPRFWDSRTVERRIRKGLMTRKEYEKHLKSLDDVADKSETINVGEEPAAGGNGVPEE